MGSYLTKNNKGSLWLVKWLTYITFPSPCAFFYFYTMLWLCCSKSYINLLPLDNSISHTGPWFHTWGHPSSDPWRPWSHKTIMCVQSPSPSFGFNQLRGWREGCGPVTSIPLSAWNDEGEMIPSPSLNALDQPSAPATASASTAGLSRITLVFEFVWQCACRCGGRRSVFEMPRKERSN